MNKNLDLVKILKNCPAGTPLFSPIFGDVKFIAVLPIEFDFPIQVLKDGVCWCFSRDGRYNTHKDAECTLWPSRECRDWSKFVKPEPKPKYDFKPFDRVLVRNSNNYWRIAFFDFEGGEVEHHHYYVIGSINGFDQCLPYEGNEYLKNTNKPKED